MNIKVIQTDIPEVKIFQPQPFIDERGYLIESFNKELYKNHLPSVDFVQDNESKSSFGVLRGLHYQDKPYLQAKLVRVVQGEIQDVAVDIRKESKTYLKYVSVILSEKNMKQMYIPRGFAHGFLVLSDTAIVCYKIDNLFKQDLYRGIRYDDPQIGINWKLEKDKLKLSEKDKHNPFI
tara:strand:+ start:495 stop:1028 length:534 start_codon:yes stop_codon:yes gene_type:complete